MKLNFSNDTTYISDRSIPTMCSTNGHYSLPLARRDLEVENTSIVLHKHISDLCKTEKERKHESCIEFWESGLVV